MNVFAVPLRQIVPCRAPFTDAFWCWERPSRFYDPYELSEFSFRWESKRFLHSITTHYGIRVRGEVILAYSELTGQFHAAAALPLYSFDSKFGGRLPVSAVTWWKRKRYLPLSGIKRQFVHPTASYLSCWAIMAHHLRQVECLCFTFMFLYLFPYSTRWHCATSRKFAGSFPGGVIGTFHLQYPSGRTMALRLTLPLT